MFDEVVKFTRPDGQQLYGKVIKFYKSYVIIRAGIDKYAIKRDKVDFDPILGLQLINSSSLTF